MRPVQYFTDEYLESCRRMSATQIAAFLESFRCLHAKRRPARLISMKVDQDLLDAFRIRCEAEGVRYQTRIKELMEAWLMGERPPGC